MDYKIMSLLIIQIISGLIVGLLLGYNIGYRKGIKRCKEAFLKLVEETKTLENDNN
jgi:Na+/H+-dicarboxylate symporter